MGDVRSFVANGWRLHLGAASKVIDQVHVAVAVKEDDYEDVNLNVNVDVRSSSL